MTTPSAGCNQQGMTAFTIYDLRDQPARLDLLSERVWQAFWRHKGAALADIARGFTAHLRPGDLPFTLLAESGACFSARCR